MMPKLVAFDLGKVLLDFSYRHTSAELARHAKTSADQIFRCLITDDMLVKYEMGALTFNDFYAQFCLATGYHGTQDYFVYWLGNIFSPITPMIDLHAQIRARGLPTWIFSNTNDIAVHFITENFPFFKKFTGYIYSFEVRSMKPEPGMYEELERRSGCRGTEILYLDDRPENIAAGLARGWQSFVHEDPARTIPQVKALLQMA